MHGSIYKPGVHSPVCCFRSASITQSLDVGTSSGLFAGAAIRGHRPGACAFPLAGSAQIPHFNVTKPRHRMSQDYPLNLSISLSGGEETNQDAPSNGE